MLFFLKTFRLLNNNAKLCHFLPLNPEINQDFLKTTNHVLITNQAQVPIILSLQYLQ